MRSPVPAAALQPARPQAVRLSAAVMAHPSRAGAARALADRHPELGLRVVLDPAPELGPSPLRTARLAWGAVAGDATHHLVVQDDVQLCDDFAARLRAAAAALPDRALCLFAEWGSATSYALRLAALTGAAWTEVADYYLPSVALLLPAPVARAFAAAPAPPLPQDDVALRGFLAESGVIPYVAVPNLVEHLPGPSLAGNDRMGVRRSACFLPGGPASPEGPGRVAVPALVPFFSWVSGLPGCLVREGPPGSAWRRAAAGHLPRARGLPTAEVVAAGRKAVAHWAERAGGDIDPKLVFGLWVTAFGLGVEAGAPGGGDPGWLDAALARPVARRALDTMPAGALRALVDGRSLAAAEPTLGRLLRDALRQGYEARRAARRGGAPAGGAA